VSYVARALGTPFEIGELGSYADFFRPTGRKTPHPALRAGLSLKGRGEIPLAP